MTDPQRAEIDDAEVELITDIALELWRFLVKTRESLVKEAIQNRICGKLLEKRHD